MAEAEREILTWEAFDEGGRELARQIADDGYRPDIILAIARGGLFTAGLPGYALSVKNIYVINVEYYTGVEERLPMPVALLPTPELVDIEDASLLIADDVGHRPHTCFRPRLLPRACRRRPYRRPLPEAALGDRVRVRGAAPTGGSTSVVPASGGRAGDRGRAPGRQDDDEPPLRGQAGPRPRRRQPALDRVGRSPAGCTRRARAAFTYQGERIEKSVRELAESVDGKACHRVRRPLGHRPRPSLHRGCRSSARHPRPLGCLRRRRRPRRRFVDTPRDRFGLAVDVSAYSFVACAKRAERHAAYVAAALL